MKRLYGNLSGLKPSQLKRIERITGRRVSPAVLISTELARDVARISSEIRRQIGLLINRKGKVACVIVGDHHQIFIPGIVAQRVAAGRLTGLRCVHTHLKPDPLSQEDLTDLVLLRLDMMATITLTPDGRPDQIYAAHILPGENETQAYEVMPPIDPYHPDRFCLETILALEAEMAQQLALRESGGKGERALLISVTTSSRREALDSFHELAQLAASAGIEIVDKILQQRTKIDPRILLGSGKLRDLAILAMQRDATMMVFDQELNPSQIKSITDQVELKVIDRTQLILDIFAQRAQTREGQLQVELAQLKYLLPRLISKNTAMSRLTGGIGGRGPGETKLELNRRQTRDRINRLENALRDVQKQRQQQRARRSKRHLPVVSIIGYTNAGKSTLLNNLTRSRVRAENRLFATLDPSSRRMKFPRETEVIITDTVGFIRDLPRELMTAFRATLEELENADLLLHVIDIHHPQYQKQVRSVERILEELDLSHIPTLRVLNKQDRLKPDDLAKRVNILKGVPIAAIDSQTLHPLIDAMDHYFTAGRLDPALTDTTPSPSSPAM
ncbi:MAG: GTPase HflX [Desulfobacteraceae bacterium]|nr:GTPase HflX [Desulfobacteraceae bacterium]MBC2750462.1 GTPase HflX [Desulfobacteraceae bacterium]